MCGEEMRKESRAVWHQEGACENGYLIIFAHTRLLGESSQESNAAKSHFSRRLVLGLITRAEVLKDTLNNKNGGCIFNIIITLQFN